MNVTPVTNDTANDGEQLVNNEEAQATQPVGEGNPTSSPTQENSSPNNEATNQPEAAEAVQGSAVEPTNNLSEDAPPAQEGALPDTVGEPSPAEAGAAELPEAAPAPEGAVQVDAEAIQQKAEENAPPVSLMEQLLNENEAASSVRRLEYGQAIEGILMYKDRDDMLVDIGTKSEGIVPQRERQSLSADKLDEMRVGDKVLVVVVRPESGADGEDGPILSIDKARTEVSWRKLQQQFEAGEVFEVDVVGYNKGGLMVEVEGVRGFIPASQVNALSGIGDSEENRQSQMSRLVNSKLLVKIVEVNRDRNRLILSERQAVREQREASKGRLMNELEVGQVRDGVVTTLAKFGAFIDLGGVDGLVHVSELSWARIDDPKQILSVGQPVKVYILGIDQEKQKVALSIKRTQPEPWSQVTEKYHVGELVEATISQLSNFGAFARIEEGLEGLIHISELAEGRVDRPGDIVKPGEKVKVRILRIDPENRRLALSLKRAQEEGSEGANEE
jgi:small subunit ribosomal protein S1